MVIDTFQSLKDQATTTPEEPEIPSPQIKIIEEDETYGKFHIEPLERGHGVTLANPLRRILFSSLPGTAVTWVKVEGILHEYDTIPHVKEDLIEFLLSVKSIRLRSLSGRPGKLRLEASSEGTIYAKDIMASSDFEIVNPELHLATLDSDEAQLFVEFNVEAGKGYVPAESTKGLPIGVLPVDAIFTPVRKVNFSVEPMRLGQVINYERLVLEVWTDGTTSSVEAVRNAANILVEHFFMVTNLGKVTEEGKDRSSIALSIPVEHYNTPIEKLDLSSRTLNCLKRANINKVGQILELERSELLNIRNFGEKSAEELYSRLDEMGFLPKETQGDEDAGEEEESTPEVAVEEPTPEAVAEESTEEIPGEVT